MFLRQDTSKGEIYRTECETRKCWNNSRLANAALVLFRVKNEVRVPRNLTDVHRSSQNFCRLLLCCMVIKLISDLCNKEGKRPIALHRVFNLCKVSMGDGMVLKLWGYTNVKFSSAKKKHGQMSLPLAYFNSGYKGKS